MTDLEFATLLSAGIVVSSFCYHWRFTQRVWSNSSRKKKLLDRYAEKGQDVVGFVTRVKMIGQGKSIFFMSGTSFELTYVYVHPYKGCQITKRLRVRRVPTSRMLPMKFLPNYPASGIPKFLVSQRCREYGRYSLLWWMSLLGLLQILWFAWVLATKSPSLALVFKHVSANTLLLCLRFLIAKDELFSIWERNILCYGAMTPRPQSRSYRDLNDDDSQPQAQSDRCIRMSPRIGLRHSLPKLKEHVQRQRRWRRS